MKDNYRKQPSCPNCKFVAWGKSYDCPRLFCNQDNSYNEEWLEAVYDIGDEEMDKLWEYEKTYSVHLNGICDEYEKLEDDE